MKCNTCNDSGWILLTGSDTVRACCPFCNKDGQRPDSHLLVADIFERRDYGEADEQAADWENPAVNI
jgi:hypothetical protein